MCSVSLLLFHAFFVSLVMVVAALPMRLLSSASSERVSEIVEPRQTSSSWSLMLMAGGKSTSCPMNCFLQVNGNPDVLVIVSPKLLKRVMSCCRSSAEWAVTAASSAKRKSRRHLSWTLVLALSLERLKRFSSVLVRR